MIKTVFTLNIGSVHANTVEPDQTALKESDQ